MKVLINNHRLLNVYYIDLKHFFVGYVQQIVVKAAIADPIHATSAAKQQNMDAYRSLLQTSFTLLKHIARIIQVSCIMLLDSVALLAVCDDFFLGSFG